MDDFGNWQLAIDEITSNSTTLGLCRGFGSCRSNEDRFQYVWNKSMLKEVSWLPLYWESCHRMHRKSAQKAVHFRNDGNKQFQKKQYGEALKLYNKSIQFAPLQSDNQSRVLAHGLGNRSAALYHLKQYKMCLEDISASLTAGYPPDSCHKLMTRKAYCHIHLGLTQLAKEDLLSLRTHLDTKMTDAEQSKKDSLKETIDDIEKMINSMSTESSVVSKETDIDDSPTKVSYGINDRLCQASCAVVMKHTDNKGRYLVSAGRLKAGDTLIVERPYAAVLLPDHYSTHCHHCLTQLPTNPSPCAECSVVWFCGNSCRDKAWEQYHRIECCHQHLFFSIGIAHLSLRVILTAGYQFLLDHVAQIQDRPASDPTQTVYSSEDYSTVYDLLTHEEHMAVEDLLQYTLTANLLLKVLQVEHWLPMGTPGEEGGPLSDEAVTIGGLLLRHILQLVCNAHAITELQLSQLHDSQSVDTSSQVRVATAIYPTASLMNHSCDPTIISSFQGDRLVVRAVKDVEEGEEIYNCYGPHWKRMSRAERQESLSSQYFFQCDCEPCRTEENNDQSAQCPRCGDRLKEGSDKCGECGGEVDVGRIMEEVQQAELNFSQGLQHLHDRNVTGAVRSFKACVGLRERSLPGDHRALCEARDCLARCHALTGEYAKAAGYLEQNLPCTERYYGDTSIELGYELQKLAEILYHDGQTHKALDIIDRAISIFSIQFGEGSRDKNVLELQQMKECLLGKVS